MFEISKYAEPIIYGGEQFKAMGNFKPAWGEYLLGFGLWLTFLTALAIAIMLTTRQVKNHLARIDQAELKPSPVKVTRKELIVCCGLFAAALLLRLWGIGFESMDAQEYTYFTKAIRSESFLFILLNPFMVSPHLPLDRVLLFFWTKLFPSFEMARVLAAIIGALTVPALYLWLKRSYGLFAAIVAAGLLALSPFHIYFSQAVSPYSLLGLVLVGSCALHYPALKHNSSKAVRVGYIAVNALGFICHFAYWFLFLGLALEVLHRFLFSKKEPVDKLAFWRFTNLLSYSLIPLFLYSLGLIYFMSKLKLIGNIMGTMKIHYHYANLTEGLVGFATGLFDFLAYGHASAFGSITFPWLSLVALPFILIGILYKKDGRRQTFWIMFLPVAILVGSIIANGLFTIFKLGFYDFAIRRLVSQTPIIYALFAIGLQYGYSQLTGTKRQNLARVVTASVLIVLAAGQIYDIYQTKTVRQKADLEAAVEYVSEKLEDGDGIAIGPYAFYEGIFNYYFLRPKSVNWYSELFPPRWRRPGAPATGGGCIFDRCAADPKRCKAIKTSRLFLALNNLYLDWQTVLGHTELKRVWFFEVTEKPYEFLELLGRGTNTVEDFRSNDFKSCGIKEFTKIRIHCFERPQPLPAADFLTIGKDDYRQISGFTPGGFQKTLTRRLTNGARLNFSRPSDAETLRLKIEELAFLPAVDLILTIRAGTKISTERLQLKKGLREYNIDLSAFNEVETDRFSVCFEVRTVSDRMKKNCLNYGVMIDPNKEFGCGLLLHEAEVIRNNKDNNRSERDEGQ
jgi:Dolichyl-phosphate-mannose-protein mannosyltransferase